MEEKRFTLRMDGRLFEDICALAKEHRRSTAKEIECAIAKYVVAENFQILKDKKALDELQGTLTDEKLRAYGLVLQDLHDKYDVIIAAEDECSY